MAVFLSGPRCVKLPCVASPRRLSLLRQVCHHCLPRRLSLWQPPAGPGVTPLLAHWRLGLWTPNCNECPNCLLSTCSNVHVLLSLFYVIDCHVMWLCIMNEIFVWTQVVNKLLLLLLGLLHDEFGLLLLNKIQDMIQNVNTSVVMLKTMQHVKS